jgi:hypothetical protein
MTTRTTSGSPEPATVFLMMGALGVAALVVAARESLKLRNGT